MSTPAPSSAPSGYALFDLDQTLVPYDMQLLFGNWCLQHHPWRRVYLPLFLCALPAAKLLGARRMKRLYMSFLHGMSVSEVEKLSRAFVEHYFPSLLYPEIVTLLRQHQQRGDLTILTSASPSVYVHQIGAFLGVDATFCTEVLPPEGTHYPLLPEIPENNKGATKTTRLHYWLRSHGNDTSFPLPNSTAYTDSTADLPLIANTERAVLVHPSPRLIAETKDHYQRPVEIHHPQRPFSSQLGHLVHCIMKLLGIYPIHRNESDHAGSL